MAYSDFTSISQVEKKYQLSQKKTNLFSEFALIEASDRLKMELTEAQEYYSMVSEKAKSEFLIAPVLRELHRRNKEKVNLFSGIGLTTDISELNGYCDYILSLEPDTFELKSPIFCLVEAKNRTVEEGFGQCAAEMYAAHLFNLAEENPLPYIYGVVTTGYDWAFLKLQQNIIYVDTARYSLRNLSELMGVLQFAVNAF